MGSDLNTQALLMKFQHLYLMNVLIQLQRRCNKWYARVKQKLSLLINRKMHLHRYWSIKKNDTQTVSGTHHYSHRTVEDTVANQSGENFISGLNQMLLSQKAANVSIPMQVLLLPMIVPYGAANQTQVSPSVVTGEQAHLAQMKMANRARTYQSQSTSRIPSEPLPKTFTQHNSWANVPLNNRCSQIQFSSTTGASCTSTWMDSKASPHMADEVQCRNFIY